MAAGDFLVRRNNANTDTIPNAGSDLLLLWDTAVDNEGSGITYNSGTFTLGETGRFLVVYSEQYQSLTVTDNQRLNVKTTLTLAGTELVEGYHAGYLRKKDGCDEFVNFGAAIINVSTTTGNGDELQIRAERIDNVTSSLEAPDRVPDRSGVAIIKLDDTWDYGRYESSSTFSSNGTDNGVVVANLGTTNEEDATFTRTNNTIDIATNNYVLAVYSLKNETAPGFRAEFQSRLTLGGSVVPGSYAHTYVRDMENAIWGGMSNVCLLNPTSGQDLELELVTRETGGGGGWSAALQLVELPSAAEAIIVEATTGDFNAAATNFSWDTNPVIDSAAFTHTAGNANIDVDNAGDYLVMASQATETPITAARMLPFIGFRVNSTDISYAGNTSFARKVTDGTAEYAAVTTSTLLTNLSANDSIYTRNDQLSDEGASINCDVGAMSLLRLSSLFSAPPTPTPTQTSTSTATPTPTPSATVTPTPSITPSTAIFTGGSFDSDGQFIVSGNWTIN